MAFIFSQIHADIAPEIIEKCKNCFPTLSSKSSGSVFSPLVTNICTLTGANFVDGEKPQLWGSWHAVKDTYDLLAGLFLQQHINILQQKHYADNSTNYTTFDHFVDEEDLSVDSHSHSAGNGCMDESRAPAEHEKLDAVPRTIGTDHHEHEDHIININDSSQSNTLSGTGRNIVIDFQDVNFETLQNLGRSEESMDNVSKITHIKQEFEDDSYACSYKKETEPPNSYRISTALSGIGPRTSCSPAGPGTLDNESVSMHMKMEDYDSCHGDHSGHADEGLISYSSEASYMGEPSPQSLAYPVVSPQAVLHSGVTLNEGDGVCTTRMKNVIRPSVNKVAVINTDSDPNVMFARKKSGDGNPSSFFCLYCHYKATCQKNVEDHVRRVHSERLFHCNMCPTKFGVQRDLTRHYKIKHKMAVPSQRPGRRPKNSTPNNDPRVIQAEQNFGEKSCMF